MIHHDYRLQFFPKDSVWRVEWLDNEHGPLMETFKEVGQAIFFIMRLIQKLDDIGPV